MKLTTRGYYSIKALLDLSLRADYGPVSVREIAQRQSLPAPYLEKLLIKLRQAGLIESVRGVQGGYKLERSPAQISLGHILEAVGESIEPMSKMPRQENAEDWVTNMVWQRINQRMKAAIYEISLEDLYYDARSWQAAQGEAVSFIV
ncbi:MAG: Rrf2 family transcriptional regulator [Leptolyngbyaceae bacterium]|nr:Rrf2 family transcriptional regulator [Leptolyngbyaceae bacterium]